MEKLGSANKKTGIDFDPGFCWKKEIHPTGFEQTAKSRRNNENSGAEFANRKQNQRELAISNPDLAELIERWEAMDDAGRRELLDHARAIENQNLRG